MSRATLDEDQTKRSLPLARSLAYPGPDTALYSSLAAPSLSDRRWLSRAGGRVAGNDTVSVATYNMLAHCYATPGYFTQTDAEVLDWHRRKKAILDVLDGLDADVLCLQEVDHFESFLLPELRKRGYAGRFKKRNGPRKRDGCATFWREDKFRLVSEQAIELDHAARASLAGPGYDTHNVALILVLAPRATDGSAPPPESHTVHPIIAHALAGPAASFSGNTDGNGGTRGLICVANAHLFWDPAYAGVKLLQARAVAKRISHLEKRHGQMYTVFCGDLNSLPGTRVYEYLTREEGFTSAYSCIQQLAALQTAKDSGQRAPAAHVYGMDVRDTSSGKYEPEFSNFRDNFSGTLDYILLRGLPAQAVKRLKNVSLRDHRMWSPGQRSFADMCKSKGSNGGQGPHLGEPAAAKDSHGGGNMSRVHGLCVEGIMAMPSAESLGPRGLPNQDHPSDHLPLACRLSVSW